MQLQPRGVPARPERDAQCRSRLCLRPEEGQGPGLWLCGAVSPRSGEVDGCPRCLAGISTMFVLIIEAGGIAAKSFLGPFLRETGNHTQLHWTRRRAGTSTTFGSTRAHGILHSTLGHFVGFVLVKLHWDFDPQVPVTSENQQARGSCRLAAPTRATKIPRGSCTLSPWSRR